jgi:Beta-galactosidase trimerisation domain
MLHRHPRYAIHRLLALSFLCSFTPSVLALKLTDVPTFRLRIRVISFGGEQPTGHKFPIHFQTLSTEADGPNWSSWLVYDAPQVSNSLKAYPNVYLKDWPLVLRVQINGISDPTRVVAELSFDETGNVVPLEFNLFGPNMGIVLWRDAARTAHAATMAVYNRRYWKELRDVNLGRGLKPRHFVLVDRFIGGDDDRIDWMEGFENLSRAGFTAIMAPSNPPMRELLREAGVSRTGWAVYSPPGYAFSSPLPGTKQPESPTVWAMKEAKPYLDNGFTPQDIAVFAMSDEPGWYYPAQYRMLQDAEANKRFRDYLESNGLTPRDLGSPAWDSVMPIGRSAATDLPSKRLFYWTQRFFSWDSSNYFARSTRELENAFYPGIPISTNWNFFAGRMYVPGPVANNPDKSKPDAAMGGHDWLEFGRLRGSTALWTEDWFSDAQAYQWSFYASKLRSAADKSSVVFGGYVVPRAAGDREDGILQKILTLIGSGAKVVNSYVFGPEYTFPGNCYSENPGMLQKLARANAMIGAAEDVLWPGKRPRAKVAILSPKSSEMWDAKNIPIPTQISDATNTDLNRFTVDYMAEVADLYLALQHANIPVDFIEEEDLSFSGLAQYRVVYVTEPDIPEEFQRELATWVEGGGTLIAISNAGAMDRYDEPSTILASLRGEHNRERERMLIPNLGVIQALGKVQAGSVEATAWGPRDTLVNSKGDVVAHFADNSPAVIRRVVNKGTVVYFTWLPGLSYAKSSNVSAGKLPWNFSPIIRNWIVAPVKDAGIQLPVETSEPMVEAPMLCSSVGAAVTVLNWNNDQINNLELTIRVPYRVKSVASVIHGPLKFEQGSHNIHVSLPVMSADIVVIKPYPVGNTQTKPGQDGSGLSACP